MDLGAFSISLAVKDIKVSKGDKSKVYQEAVHLIGKEEFEDMFDKASLKILHIFGDYELRSFDPVKSDRLILIAQKI